MQGHPQKLQSAFKLFDLSVEAVKVNVVLLAVLVASPTILILVELLILMLGGAVASLGDAALVIGSLIMFGSLMLSFVAYLFIIPATTAVQLQSARGERITFRQAFNVGKRFWLRYLGLGICMALIIGIGLLLFIIPGLFMLRRYILAPYYMLDRNLGVFDSLSASAEDSKRFAGAIWGLIGVQFLASLAGFIPFGFIISLLYICAPAIRYLEIKNATGAHHHPTHPHPTAHHAPQIQPAGL